MRALQKETAGVIDTNVVRKKDFERVIWEPRSRSAVFLVELCQGCHMDLPAAYAVELSRLPSSKRQGKPLRLSWTPLKHLQDLDKDRGSNSHWESSLQYFAAHTNVMKWLQRREGRGPSPTSVGAGRVSKCPALDRQGEADGGKGSKAAPLSLPLNLSDDEHTGLPYNQSDDDGVDDNVFLTCEVLKGLGSPPRGPQVDPAEEAAVATSLRAGIDPSFGIKSYRDEYEGRARVFYIVEGRLKEVGSCRSHCQQCSWEANRSWSRAQPAQPPQPPTAVALFPDASSFLPPVPSAPCQPPSTTVRTLTSEEGAELTKVLASAFFPAGVRNFFPSALEKSC